jgi:hypothetical protein
MKKLPNIILFREVESALKSGKQVKIRIAGRSMEPFLTENKDIVMLVPFMCGMLRRGDVVLFKTGEFYCLHRIIHIQKERIVLCGDGVYHSVEVISLGDILGILHSVIRQSGKVVTCNSLRWRTASCIWMAVYPFRKYLLFIYRKFQCRTEMLLFVVFLLARRVSS